ncbi:hypothetical protein Dimus_012102 [Dionaea muscipula]
MDMDMDMDHTLKASSVIKDDQSEELGMEESKKSCTDCKTTTTPLWRVGPAGPRTLCNACGIRYRKKKEEDMGSPPSKSQQQGSMSPQPQSKSRRQQRKSPQQQNKCSKQRRRDKPSSGSGSSSGSSPASSPLPPAPPISSPQPQPQPQVMKKQRSSRRLGEVERAAVLLLSLSWGSVSA